MDEGFSQTKHLVGLDFDISRIFKQLEEIEQLLKSKGLSLQEIIRNNFNIDDVMVQQINAASKQLKKLGIEISNFNTKTAGGDIRLNVDVDAALKRIETLENKIKALQSTASVKTTIATPAITSAAGGTSSGSLLSEIRAKSKWYLAGSAAFAGGMVAKDTIQTLTDVEYKIMEITRVMEDSTLNARAFRDELMNYAVAYGTNFDDVAEIAKNFAQAGYSASETLLLTKQSLLALNTAELDAQNSTESMIGIMKQWDMSAEDMSGIIDKINKTADDYTVSSQDLVDGLLRSSAAAKNTKISFDETVGVLTVLKEASGRTGKEVGNALNSIIAYTQKAKNLDVFESLGVQVYADKARTTFVPVIQMISELSQKVKEGGDGIIDTLERQTDLTAMYSEEIAKAAGVEEQYAAAVQAENEANKEGLSDVEKKAAFDMANMYRRNYWISLLYNFANVQGVVNNLQDAEGYSMQENARTMETLDKKTSALIESLKQLAVQAGDAGFMDLAKGAIDAATGITQATKSAGGIAPVLFQVAGVITLIKRANIATSIKKVQTGIGNTALTISKFHDAVSDAGGALNAFKNFLSGVNVSTELVVGTIGGLISAFSTVAMIIGSVQQAQEESRRQAYEAADAAVEEQKTLSDLIAEYEKLKKAETPDSTNRERILEIQTSIVDMVGEQADGISLVNGKLEEQLDILGQIQTKSAQSAQEALRTAANLAEDKFNEGAFDWLEKLFGGESNPFLPLSRVGELDAAELTNKGLWSADVQEMIQTLRDPGRLLSGKDAQEQLDVFQKYAAMLNKIQESGIDVSKSLSFVSSVILELNTIIGDSENAITAYNSATAQIFISSKSSTAKVGNAGEFKTFRDELIKSAQTSGQFKGSTEQITAAIDNALKVMPQYSEFYKTLATNTQTSTSALEQFASATAMTDDEVKALESGIKLLDSAMQKAAQGQSLNVDEVMNLITAYPQLANAVQITADGYYIEAGALEQARLAEQNKLITQQLAIATTQFSATATQAQKDKLNELVVALSSATSAEAVLSAQTAIFQYIASNATNATGDFAVALAKLKLLINEANTGFGGAKYVGGSGKTATQKHIEELQKATKIIQEEYQKQIEAARKASQAMVDFYNDKIDAIKKAADKEIEALRRIKEARDRTRDRADMQEEIDYWSKRTGVEAFDNLKDAKKKLKEKEEDWAIDDLIQDIEDTRDAEVERLETLRDEEKKKYEEEIERLQALKDAEAEKSNKEIEALQNIANTLGGIGRNLEEIAKKDDENAAKQKQNADNVYSSWFEVYWAAKQAADEAQRLRQLWDNGQIPGGLGYMEQIANGQASIPQSHTGSVVTKDGAVNVEAGEVIVRKDLSAQLQEFLDGQKAEREQLIQNAQRPLVVQLQSNYTPQEISINPEIVGNLSRVMTYNNAINNTHNNYSSSTYNDTDRRRSVNINFNGPLNNVEHQEIHDQADARLTENDILRKLMHSIHLTKPF